MSTSTIENIAIGVRPTTPTNNRSNLRDRRNNAKKTRRRISFAIDDIISPAHPRAWQASLKESFTNRQAFDIILQDINKLDSEFSDLLVDTPNAFLDSAPSSFSSLSRYQEYVDAFVSLFAQSKFDASRSRVNENEVTESLYANRCPKKKIFRRLAINPFYLAEDNPESPERVQLDCGSVLKAQLARMCDVSILKFLSTVTDKTNIHSVLWALDYLAEMTKRLDLSIRTQSDAGWYGITFRKRKDTIRRSVIDVPQLAVDGNFVIGLGPTSSINPETGQPLNTPSSPISIPATSPVPSIAITPEGQFSLELDKTIQAAAAHPPTPSSDPPPPSSSSSTSKLERLNEAQRSDPPPTGPQRRYSTATRPILSPLVENTGVTGPPQRRSSTGSRPPGGIITSGRFPPRKSSMTMAPFNYSVGIESIAEEENETPRVEEHPVRTPSPSSLRAGLRQHNVPPTISESASPSLDFLHPLSSTHPSMSPPRASPSSPLSSSSSLSLSIHASPSPNDRNSTHSTDVSEESESESSDSDEQSVRQKTPEPLVIKGTTLSDEDIQRELQSFITHEGRISLLAILKAVIQLPSSATLWTDDSWEACNKCFSLIQFCMDFGLEAFSKEPLAEPKRLIRQKSVLPDRKHEKASVTYSRYVLQYAIKALIHCAVCTYTGCSSNSCLLSSYSLQNTRNASQNLNKMTHLLERLYSNSPLQYRDAVMEFSRQATLKEVFHFLHVMLQYCPRSTSKRDNHEPSSSIVLSASVFRIIMDRMIMLDLNEPTVKHNIVREAVSFVHFAMSLFDQDFIISKGFHHLHHYIQRVACSVLLPIPSSTPPLPPPSSSLPPILSPTPADMGTFPRRKDKSKPKEEDGPLNRKRGKTFTGAVPEPEGRSPLFSRKSPRVQVKSPSPLTKQNSVDNDPEPDDSVLFKEHPVISALKEEWRGLKIGALHQRIRRLTLLLDLSEPGTIPEPSLLSSLFNVGPPGTVVPKALVLLECCLFVKKINSEGGTTVWLNQNQSGSHWDLFYLLRKWAEAIGDGLKECIKREKELLSKATSGADYSSHVIEEEPVFTDNDDNDSTDKVYTVNHSLKMMGCILLLEITQLLRQPPTKLLSHDSASSTSYMSHAYQPQHPPSRKISNISNFSTDSETIGSSPYLSSPVEPRGAAAAVRRMSSEYQLRPNIVTNIEDVPKFMSVEHPLPSSDSAQSRKVSVYLRINNRYGRQGHNLGGSSFRRAPPSSPGYSGDAPSDGYRVPGLQASPKQAPRRMSLSTAAFHRLTGGGGAGGGASHEPGGGVGLNRGISIPGNRSGQHRKSFSITTNRDVNAFSASAKKKDSTSSHTQRAAPTVQPSPPSIRRVNNRRRPSVISRFLQRGRHAFRRPRAESTKKRSSTTTQASSVNSSPSFAHRRMGSYSHSRQDSSSYHQKVEDLRTNFSWLDTVEHLVIHYHKSSEAEKGRHRQSCHDLISALRHIYSIQLKDLEDLSVTPPSALPGNRVNATLARPPSHVSISTIFSDVNTLSRRRKGVKGPANVTSPDVLVMETLKLLPGGVASRAATKISQSNVNGGNVKNKNFSQRLAELDFSSLRLRFFLESGKVWGSLSNDDNQFDNFQEDIKNLTLDWLMEVDSAASLEQLMSDYNHQRLEYCDNVLSGLLHAPFSLMTYAGPVLDAPVFRDLRPVAWDALLDADDQCANSAACFFLLSCVKGKEDISTVFSRNSKVTDLASMRDTIKRFKKLWSCRDSVWSKMEDGAGKHFSLDEDKTSKDAQSIGYSLPPHLMGSFDEDMPFPSWTPKSVCCNQSCTQGVSTSKCYQSTSLAPLIHLSDIASEVLSCHVSMINIVTDDDTGASTTLIEVDKDDFEHGIINVKDRIKLSVFPNTLLPLIDLVIRSLCILPSSSSPSSSDVYTVSSAQLAGSAEEVLWQCMLEHPHDLFLPLLNEFNRLYQIVRDQKRYGNLTAEETAEEQLGNIIKPFHILLCHFPILPTRAAHFLFNHFVGIIMRHTEQPLELSDSIVQSVLGLLRMVASSVKCLSMKELKNQLKKESCYTALLTTARIRGVEKVTVTNLETDANTAQEFVIDSDDMSFVHLIAKVRDMDPTSSEFLSTFNNYYLTDQKTDLPVLSNLIIQDYYPTAPDGSSPHFQLCKISSSSRDGGAWSNSRQLDMLHVHKMSEIARVQFACQMLLMDTMNEQKFSEPNSVFIFEELLKSSSFPRKTLDSVGPSALSKWHLRVTDSMLRGVWSKFILTIFTQMEDYQPDDCIILYLTVLNGSLFLQSEDQTILRNTLAALLTAVAKFNAVFRSEGYQMVVPSLVQVYALHRKNKMVTAAIEYVWIAFYRRNQNLFLLQAISSIANLFNPDVSSLATALGVNFSPLKFADEEELAGQQYVLERASVDLLKCLDSPEDSLPPDPIDMLGACHKGVNDDYMKENWSSCSPQQVLTLCVTIAAYDPEELRGMQILVFLDHLMPLLMREKGLIEETLLINSVRHLVKGCDALKKSQVSKGSELLAATKKGGAHATAGLEPPIDPNVDAKLSAYVKKLLFIRHRAGTSQDLHDRSATELQNVPPAEPAEQLTTIVEGFKSRTISDVQSNILNISRDSLLSIASQFLAYTSKLDSATTASNKRCPLDLPSLTCVASIVDKIMRQGMKPNSSHMLISKGFTRTLLDLFPAIEWTSENKSVFIVVLERAVKLFKKVQLENQRDRSFLTPNLWSGMETLLESYQQCINKSPPLLDSEPILNKMKYLVDMCLAVKTSFLSSQSFGVTSASTRSVKPFIFEAPPSFISTVVKLMAEIIVASHKSTNRNKVLLQTFFSGKLHFKETESPFVWKKLFLPLTINLGLRGVSEAQDDADAMFLLETIFQIGEQIETIIKYRSLNNQYKIERFFLDLKVIFAAFSHKFSLENWAKIAGSIFTVISRTDYIVLKPSSGEGTNETYIRFCFMLLDFMEHFILLSRIPFYTIVWQALYVIERHLTCISEQCALEETHPIRPALNSCLQKCHRLSQTASLNPVTPSKQELLNKIKKQLLIAIEGEPQELSEPFFPFSTFSTGSEGTSSRSAQVLVGRASLRRRNSKQPNFPVIVEAVDESEPEVTQNTRAELLHKRPTTLSLREDTNESSSLERKGKKASSLTTPKSLTQVGFGGKPLSAENRQPLLEDDGSNNNTSTSATATGKSKVANNTPERIKKPHRRSPRLPIRDRMSDVKEEDCWDADSEESGQDTPRSSFSYTHSPYLAPHSLPEASPLTVTAEVHSYSPLSRTSFKSLDVAGSHGDVVQQRMRATTESSVNSNTAGGGGGGRSNRPRLTRVSSIHDQPDEQTGQPRKDYDVRVTPEPVEEVRTLRRSGSNNISVTNKLFDTAFQETFDLLPSSGPVVGDSSNPTLPSRDSQETLL